MKQWLPACVGLLFCKLSELYEFTCVLHWQQDTAGWMLSANSRIQMGWIAGRRWAECWVPTVVFRLAHCWVLPTVDCSSQPCSTYTNTNARFGQTVVLTSKCLLKMLRWCELSCTRRIDVRITCSHITVIQMQNLVAVDSAVVVWQWGKTHAHLKLCVYMYCCDVLCIFIQWFLHVLCVTCADYNIAGLHWRG